MEILQQILVLLTFLIALGYLLTRFFGKPAFLGGKKKAAGACGVAGDCKCGD